MNRADVVQKLGALALGFAASYLGLALPEQHRSSELERANATIERQLDKREAQIERREKRVADLEDQLEECLDAPIPRGFTPGLAERAAEGS